MDVWAIADEELLEEIKEKLKVIHEDKEDS